MATTNNDPRFAEYNPPSCKECGNQLRFASEIENDNLCVNCGPGSAKHQEREGNQRNQQFVQQSTAYTQSRNQYGLLADTVQRGIDSGFNDESVAAIKAVLESHSGAFTTNSPEMLNKNAEATEDRMRNAPTVGTGAGVDANARATEQRIEETVNPEDDRNR